MKLKWHFGLAVGLLLISGCSTTVRTGDLTLISTKNISSFKNAEDRGVFEGTDCKAFSPPNVKEAIDKAIEQGDGNALTDAVLYLDQAPFQNCFRAKGKVVRLKEEGSR